MLKEKLGIDTIDNIGAEYNQDENLDLLWDLIAGCILKTAYKALPSKEVKAGVSPIKNFSKSSAILKELRVLGKLCHKCIENKGKRIEEEERYSWSKKIRELNEKLELSIEDFTEEIWTEERGKSIKT
jgi:hypothetical protein